MSLGKLLTRGLAVVATVALPVWMCAQPASAFESHSKEDIVDHTFIDPAGDSVTCTVQYDSSLFRDTPSDPFEGEAATQILLFNDPGDTDACRAAVAVEIDYHDLAGKEQHARAFGIELADLQLDAIAGNFVAFHSVFFLNCAENCTANFTTSPK